MNTVTDKLANRRNVLRGMIGGAAVTVGLPFLDGFLNSHGTALAATGAALPVCFGTWYQGLGFNVGRWLPDRVGPNFEHNVELKMFDPFKPRMNVISGTKYFMDGRPLETHSSSWQIASTGMLLTGVNSGPSLDSMIADSIGTRTRFRSLEVSLDGSRGSYSNRSGGARNPSEASPAALYARIFGPEFKDPNAADFTPDPMVMARQSVLSAVAEERRSVMGQLGASDRARLDEYFTSVRQIEHQLGLEMQKPSPLPACSMPEKIAETKVGRTVVESETNNKLLAQLMAHALACGQTRVFNVQSGGNGLRKPGSTQTWHSWTHEEPIDPVLGYQVEVTWFINWANTQFATFLHALDGLKEGSGTVLDRTTVLWQTDHGHATTHTMEMLPILMVGNASGRFKTGQHVALLGDPATRVGLTMQQAFGVPIATWGQLSNETSKTVNEILA